MKGLTCSVELISGPDSRASFSCKFYSTDTYEWAFKQAGFAKFEWKEIELSDNEPDPDYWKDCLKNSPIIGFKALK